MPSIVLQPIGGLGIDTYIDSLNTTGSHGSSDQLWLGKAYSGGLDRIILEFNVGSLPPGSTLDSGESYLTLFTSGAPAGTIAGTAYRLTRPEWREVYATYSCLDTDVPWETAGGDYSTADPVGAPFSVTTMGNLVIQGTAFDSLLSNAIDNASDLSLILVPSSTIYTAKFYSSEYSNVSLRPKLYISYSSAAGVSTKGFKSVMSKWLTSDEDNYANKVCGTHIALGTALQDSVEYASDMVRLVNEIGREKIESAFSYGNTARMSANFRAGHCTDYIKEIGLLSSYSVNIATCDDLTGWSGSSLSLNTTGQVEGASCLMSTPISGLGSTRSALFQSLSINAKVEGSSLDDYLSLWFWTDDVSLPDTDALTVVAGKDSVTRWRWLEVPLASTGWNQVLMRFSEASDFTGSPTFDAINYISVAAVVTAGHSCRLDNIQVLNDKSTSLIGRVEIPGSTAKLSSDNWKVVIKITPVSGKEIQV